MKAFVILNPVAGRTKATDVRQAIDRHLNRDGWQVDIYQTKAGEPVCEVVRDRVEEGESLLTIHANDEDSLAQARSRLLSAISWSDEPVTPPPHMHQIIH